ncbi:MAG: DUF2782 domain-containing protein [Burkholderiales bacterium]
MRHLMTLMLIAAAVAATVAVAQPAAAQNKPGANAQPIPEPPPPPPGFELDPALEPQVTIRKRGEDTVEEYRIAGKLYMIKVTPPGGTPYYMIDEVGNGNFSRRDGPVQGVRPPMWVIHSF